MVISVATIRLEFCLLMREDKLNHTLNGIAVLRRGLPSIVCQRLIKGCNEENNQGLTKD